MGEDDRDRRSHAEAAELGRRRAPRAGPRRRARALRRLEQGRVALPDVEERHTEARRRRNGAVGRSCHASRRRSRPRRPASGQRTAPGGAVLGAATAAEIAATRSGERDARPDLREREPGDETGRRRRDTAASQPLSQRERGAAGGRTGWRSRATRREPSSGATAGACERVREAPSTAAPRRSGARGSAPSRRRRRPRPRRTGPTPGAEPDSPRRSAPDAGRRGRSRARPRTRAGSPARAASPVPREQHGRPEEQEVPAVTRRESKPCERCEVAATPARTTEGCQPTART